MFVRTLTGALAFGLALSMGFGASPASAQQWGDPEGGDTWTQPPPDQQPPPQQPPPQQPPPQQQQQWQQQPQQQPPPQEQPPAWTDTEQPPAEQRGNDGEDDHMAVVGHLGVGWFGVQTVPYPGPTGNPSVPTVGIRYWIAESIGLDAALGFTISTGSTSTEVRVPGSSTIVDGDLPFTFALRLHAGLPVALYHSDHYKFLIIPELDIGFASGDDGGLGQFSGFEFRAGARAGAEIHFGFMDVPQLSLQATIGAGLAFQSTTADTCDSGDCDVMNTIATQSGFVFQTSQFEEPWDIVKAEVAAIYYF